MLLDISHQLIIVDGSIPEEIMKIAQKYRATSIIIGKKDKKDTDKRLIGSVSEAILANSSIPVIAIN